jgi:hypothetical protein
MERPVARATILRPLPARSLTERTFEMPSGANEFLNRYVGSGVGFVCQPGFPTPGGTVISNRDDDSTGE